MFKLLFLIIILLPLAPYAQYPVCITLSTKSGFMSDLLNKVVLRGEVASVSESMVAFRKIDVISGIEPDSIIQATWEFCPIMQLLPIGKEFIIGYLMADSAKPIKALGSTDILPIESDSVSGYIYPNTNYSLHNESVSEFSTQSLDSFIEYIDQRVAQSNQPTSLGYRANSPSSTTPRLYTNPLSRQLLIYFNEHKLNLKGQRVAGFQ